MALNCGWVFTHLHISSVNSVDMVAAWWGRRSSPLRAPSAQSWSQSCGAELLSCSSLLQATVVHCKPLRNHSR